MTPAHTPAAGPAPCDSEQIQFLNQIQPNGFLIELSLDWQVKRVSDNLARFLSLDPAQALGRTLEDLIGRQAAHDIRGELQALGMGKEARRIFGLHCNTGAPDGAAFDLALTRSGKSVVLEGEPAADAGDMMDRLQSLLGHLRACDSLPRLLDQMAAQTRLLTGFDRVMVYRFHQDASGEVMAERRASWMDSFLALRFPASDIPAQARALYLRNPLRTVGDVEAVNASLMPAIDLDGEMLDLSMVSLRAVAPVHLTYLENMGVAASLSLSLVVDGKLWGLLACHHGSPRQLPMRARAALEFYGQVAASVLETLLRREDEARRKTTRELHAHLMALASVDSRGSDNLFPLLCEVGVSLGACGTAMLVEGRLLLDGVTPTRNDLERLLRVLNTANASTPFATDHLESICTDWGSAPVAGVLAIPVSRSPRDYLLYFRSELVHDVKWAGEPKKLVSEDGSRFTPRHSFALWKETVRGRSASWSPAEMEAAESLRHHLIEVMLRLTDMAEKARKQNNDLQDTLIAELNHRVRNILALILGLVRQCSESATSVAGFTDEVTARIHALARAHDQLTSSGWRARPLGNMIRIEAGAYLGSKASRVLLQGQDRAISPDAFATLALVFHELITNAAKYGAFKDSHGHVEVQMQQRPGGDLSLRWSEHNGNTVIAPTRRGFGSTIIERAIPHELGGEASVEFRPSGLVAKFIIPARYVSACAENDGVAQIAKPPASATSCDILRGRSVLLVEDNLLIALETESALLAHGVDAIEVASSTGAALDILSRVTPDYAILDYNLGRETSIRVAQRLNELGTRFVFVTGYGDSPVIDEHFRHVPVLSKPYDVPALVRELTETVEH